MASVKLISTDILSAGIDALVVPISLTDEGPALAAPGALPEAVRAKLTESLAALGVTGKADEVARLPLGEGEPVVVCVGIGSVLGETSHEQLRRAAGAGTRSVGFKKVGLALDAPDAATVAAVLEGGLMGSYRYARYRKPESAPEDLILRTPVLRKKEVKAASERAQILADAVCGARDLVNTAPNDLYPESFIQAAKAAIKGTGARLSVMDEKKLAAGGFGGMLAVGQGSVRPPRLAKVTYSPMRAKHRVALVGKGITFDSGGLSIKPAAGMDAMKSDMSGAAAVLYTVIAAAKLSLPIKVTGYLALAENMPSGTAQRPGDVISMHNGTTVEVLNTDAEGRLVLGDALSLAIEEKAEAVLDIATLTGAQVVALGDQVGAIMGTEAVRQEVFDAANRCGESFWPMPLPESLRSSMDTPMADIANIGSRAGGMLVAGLFLKEFVGDTPWAHLDIAGPAFNESDSWGYTPKGGTGMGVRTMLEFCEARA